MKRSTKAKAHVYLYNKLDIIIIIIIIIIISVWEKRGGGGSNVRDTIFFTILRWFVVSGALPLLLGPTIDTTFIVHQS